MNIFYFYLKLPVVIIVPHLTPDKRLCDYYYDYAFTLLGLGDILIPGLSVNYAIIFDIASSNKRYTYFIANIFGKFEFFFEIKSKISLIKKYFFHTFKAMSLAYS